LCPPVRVSQLEQTLNCLAPVEIATTVSSPAGRRGHHPRMVLWYLICKATAQPQARRSRTSAQTASHMPGTAPRTPLCPGRKLSCRRPPPASKLAVERRDTSPSAPTTRPRVATREPVRRRTAVAKGNSNGRRLWLSGLRESAGVLMLRNERAGRPIMGCVPQAFSCRRRVAASPYAITALRSSNTQVARNPGHTNALA